MTKEDFESYMKFYRAAKAKVADVEELLKKNGFETVRAYSPEVIEGEEGKPQFIMNLIISQDIVLASQN